MKDNQSYYDEFSKTYERERHDGYHALIDHLEVSLVSKYLQPHMRVLEAGCGTGLILRSLKEKAAHAVGFDLSHGMLRKAKERNLQVVQANALSVPFASESFDIVCSFKVLAHVNPIQTAMEELVRVLKPGGWLITEFYNPYSLRGLIKKLKKPTAISDQTHDESVYTRYDTLEEIRSYLPSSMDIKTCRGVRIFTPFSQIHRWPVVGPMFRFLETHAADVPGLRRLGGFFIVVSQKSI